MFFTFRFDSCSCSFCVRREVRLKIGESALLSLQRWLVGCGVSPEKARWRQRDGNWISQRNLALLQANKPVTFGGILFEDFLWNSWVIGVVMRAFKVVFLYADLIAYFWINWNGNVTKWSSQIPSYWMAPDSTITYLSSVWPGVQHS